MRPELKFEIGAAWGFRYPNTIIMPRPPEMWSREDAFSYLHELGHYRYQDAPTALMHIKLGAEMRAWQFARTCVSAETWREELADVAVKWSSTYRGIYESSLEEWGNS